jgi:hypothetical protein
MTKLGIHVQISGNGYTFLKQKVWDKEGKKSSRKKEDVHHPTVYFSIIVSSLVEPQKNIKRCAREWTRNGGLRMNVKELQDICTDTVVSMFRISTATAKEVILGVLEMILTKAQTLAQEEDLTKFDFSFYPNVDSNEMLPAINLRIQNAKLRSQ